MGHCFCRPSIKVKPDKNYLNESNKKNEKKRFSYLGKNISNNSGLNNKSVLFEPVRIVQSSDRRIKNKALNNIYNKSIEFFDKLDKQKKTNRNKIKDSSFFEPPENKLVNLPFKVDSLK